MATLSTLDDLQQTFIGKSLKNVPTPAAVLDLGKLKNNCSRMLEAVETLDFGWRAHIKTHKTIELTRLQVGEGPGPVNIIVSTLVEAEYILPLLLEYQSAGRATNLLYSFPVTPAAVSRLSLISTALGPKGLSVMVDHPAQLSSLSLIYTNTGIPTQIFLKIDMGGCRAGVAPQTKVCEDLIIAILALETAGSAELLGLYSHAGQSYSSSSRIAALDYLRQEFESLLVTAKSIKDATPSHPLVLSVGATPTTTSVRNLLVNSPDALVEEGLAITALRATIAEIRSLYCSIEIHAGVYPTLDLQQLATHALPTQGPHAMLTWDDLAFTIIAEVASIYPLRGKDGSSEALLGAGSLALGREPCKAYSGWGILTPWNRSGVRMPAVEVENHVGWKVGRISQEHGILVWNGDNEGVSEAEEGKLEVGQKVRVWPNHACISGAGFGWYLIVDGSDEIVDVWQRCRGW